MTKVRTGQLVVMLLVVCCALFVTQTARADTVAIIGNSTGSQSTATITCSFNAQTNTFTFTINNTSPFDARITGIGFDLLPGGSGSGLNGFTGNVAFQPAGVAFVFSDADLGTVPQFNSAVLDFGFITGNSGNFNGGSPNEGLPPGIDPGDEATFTVTGAAFAGMTEAQICAAVYVRFQRVGADGEDSDVGTPGNPIPEPSSMILLGTGLIGAAGWARKRRIVRGLTNPDN